MTDPQAERSDDPSGSLLRSAGGWVCAALAIGYAFWVHNGLGVAPYDNPTQWWHATGDLIDTETVEGWVREGGLNSPGIWILSIPSLVLAIGVFVVTPAAIPRTLSLAALACTPMVAFYGLTKAVRIWEFFHWRASVVFLLTGLAIGATLASPILARSWMRQNAWVKAVLYLPVFGAVVSLVRHATGTDESLPFNFSPWPAIPVLGLEVGAYTIIGVLLGVGIGTAAWCIRRDFPGIGTAGLLIGLVTPAAWFANRFGAEPATPLFALTAVGVVTFGAFVVLTKRGGRTALETLSIATLLGAFLAFAPMATGRAMATHDYVINKFIRSQAIIDALATYYAESEDGYPDDLQSLIDGGYIDELPVPRLGFEVYYGLDWVDRFDFFYQSLGSSYVLEFTSTEWVQCAYNPPWEDEEEYAEDDEEWKDEEEGEAWSCPNARPELW